MEDEQVWPPSLDIRNKAAAGVLGEFWSRVEPPEGDDLAAACWEWVGSRIGRYGLWSFGGFRDTAHRFLWIAIHGSVDEGSFVRRTCDNPLCVNPAHMELAPHSERTQQANASKARRAGQRQSARRAAEVDHPIPRS